MSLREALASNCGWSKVMSIPGQGKSNQEQNNLQGPPSADVEYEGAQSSTLQFVTINEPQKPPDATQINTVRSHVMKNVHSQRRRRNRPVNKIHNLQSKHIKLEPIAESNRSSGRQLSSQPLGTQPKSRKNGMNLRIGIPGVHAVHGHSFHASIFPS